ncbi:MAG: hypothetical protein L7H02_03600 [Sulfolobales archaeon]|nr:hypothetical protein [Sulfolobales archaeon]
MGELGYGKAAVVKNFLAPSLGSASYILALSHSDCHFRAISLRKLTNSSAVVIVRSPESA